VVGPSLLPSLVLAVAAVRSLRDQQSSSKRQQLARALPATQPIPRAELHFQSSRQRHRNSAQQVESLLGRAADARTPAVRFDTELRQRWPLRTSGLIASPVSGQIFTPASNARGPRPGRSTRTNGGALGNREAVEVYQSANAGY